MTKTMTSRISIDLVELIREVSVNNKIPRTQASKEIADFGRRLMKNKKIIREIKF